jgi:hypothetical protein
VVVHDFLPKIINANVLKTLKDHDGKYDKSKLKYYHWKNEPFMPVEFSVCAYRLGHSMIRPGYRLNDDDATLLPIFPVASQGLNEGLTGFQAMKTNRGIDWARLIDLPGDIRSYGTDNAGDAATKKRLQFAYRIDTSLVTPLSVLPSAIAGDPPPSLGQRNLIRSFELGLPTGQDVARAMGVTPLDDADIMIGKAVDTPGDGDVLGNIASLPDLSAFKGKCPLWTYILAEAVQHKTSMKLSVTENMQITTPQLGPVGGRIVAEVFLGMLFGDNDSFLSASPNWTPTIKSATAGNFTLGDLVSYALGR